DAPQVLLVLHLRLRLECEDPRAPRVQRKQLFLEVVAGRTVPWHKGADVTAEHRHRLVAPNARARQILLAIEIAKRSNVTLPGFEPGGAGRGPLDYPLRDDLEHLAAIQRVARRSAGRKRRGALSRLGVGGRFDGDRGSVLRAHDGQEARVRV